MKPLKSLTLSVFTTALVACGSNNSKDGGKVLDPVREILDTTIVTEDSEWVGTGRILMESSLRSIRDSFHIRIAGQFLAENSAIIVHLFFDDFTYDTGLQMRLTTEQSEHDKNNLLKIEVAIPGYSFDEITTLERTLADDQSFDLRIEATNKFNSDRRLLVWNEKIVLTSTSSQQKDRVLEGNAEFDSLTQGFNSLKWGQGLNWGLSLKSMRINRATREAPFVSL